MQKYLQQGEMKYKSWDKIGKWTEYSEGIQNHIDEIFDLGIIYVDEIRKRRFKVLLDCVNGAGAYLLPQFLKDFGCEVIEMNCEKTGIFPRLPNHFLKI